VHVGDVGGNVVVGDFVALVENNKKQIKSRHDRRGHGNVALRSQSCIIPKEIKRRTMEQKRRTHLKRLGFIVAPVDGVGGGKHGCARVQRGLYCISKEYIRWQQNNPLVKITKRYDECEKN
jgi:hypothetical protein